MDQVQTRGLRLVLSTKTAAPLITISLIFIPPVVSPGIDDDGDNDEEDEFEPCIVPAFHPCFFPIAIASAR